MPKHNITNEEKKQLFQRRLNGEAVSVIATDIGVPKSTVYIDTDTALNENSERRLTNILRFIIRKGHMNQYATRRPKRKRNTLEQQ